MWPISRELNNVLSKRGKKKKKEINNTKQAANANGQHTVTASSSFFCSGFVFVPRYRHHKIDTMAIIAIDHDDYNPVFDDISMRL